MHRPSLRGGARGLTAAAGIALALILGFATAAQSADPPAPDFGSTLGDTQVTVTGPDPAKFTQISAGRDFSVALDAGGYAYAWGVNTYGQLGDSTTTTRSTPVAVKMPTGVTFTQISPGQYHVLALGSDGKTYAWGRNFIGQLGDGRLTDRNVPVVVNTSLAFTQIAAGDLHSLALTSAGKAYAWGNNASGQLGDSTTTQRNAPVAVNTSLTFNQISAGSSHSLALTSAGKAYAWGNNASGQLGDSTTTQRNAPVAVNTSLTFNQISAGSSHSLALTNADKAYAWGENFSGQLGIGTSGSGTSRSSPTAVSTALTFDKLGGAAQSSQALTSAGKAYAWGNNASGQLGDSTTTNRSTPVAVLGGLAFAQIDGDFHSVGLNTAGKAYSWGDNGKGQLGNGTTTDRSTPVAVTVPAVTVTKVAFDGTPGTDLTDLGNGKWRATTPPHPTPGKIDIVLDWTLGGVAQTPITFPESFTYVTPEVTITTHAYKESGHTTEIPPDSMIAPGTTLYFVYTIENTGRLPISIQELKREGGTIDVNAQCGKRELAPSTANTPGESTDCTAEVTL